MNYLVFLREFPTRGVVEYSLREICASLVGAFSLTDSELAMLVELPCGGRFENSDVCVYRLS